MILDGATGQIICHGQKSQKKENGYPTFNRKSLQWVSKPLLLGWWPSSMIWKQREFRPNRTYVHHRSCIKVYKNTLLEGCAINFGQKEYLEKAAGHVLDMRIIFHKAWLTVLVNHPKQILDTILLERIAKHLVLDERWYQPPVVSLQLTELANMAMPSNLQPATGVFVHHLQNPFIYIQYKWHVHILQMTWDLKRGQITNGKWDTTFQSVWKYANLWTII